MQVLRAVHYRDGRWTFLYADGSRLVTDSQPQAELLVGDELPINKYGVRITSYIDPAAGCDW